MSSIVVYDSTLRDGMQGEGMSLSVEEKLRVAHLLDDLGVPMIEAGFPASNPKEAELFALLETAGLRGQVAAFGTTRRRDTRRRRRPGAARAGRAPSRRSARWSARPGACTSRRSCASTATRTCA